MQYKEKLIDIEENHLISSLTLRNWVRLGEDFNGFSESKKDLAQHNKIYEDNTHQSLHNIRNNNIARDYENNSHIKTDFLANNVKINEDSYAHCLHQSFETFAHSLNEKIDVLQTTQLDIHHVEIVTDRIFRFIEKLRDELRTTNSYIQYLENKNSSLEDKIDALMIQNHEVTQKFSNFELMCERFFSKNTNLENKMLAIENKFVQSESFEPISSVKPRIAKTAELIEEEVVLQKTPVVVSNKVVEEQQINAEVNDFIDNLFDREDINVQYTKTKLNQENIDNINHELNVEYLEDDEVDFEIDSKKGKLNSIISWVHKVLRLD